MFQKADEEYLIRAFNKNNAILFAGAGFTSLARNILDKDIPCGEDLGKLLWSFMDFPEEFDGSALDEIYDVVLNSGKSHPQIKGFLEENLLCEHIPDEYSFVTLPYWYRIYTINVDDLFEKIYRITSKKSQILSYPHDDIEERDQSLEKTQVILLHGRLPCRPDEIIFSQTSYAKEAIRPQPLYSQFVRDYSTRPVIFIGTKLNEPLLWKYIEERKLRYQGISEQRPKSFLIAPEISIIKRAQLERFNVISVEADARAFLEWLNSIASKLVPKGEVLKTVCPGLYEFSVQLSNDKVKLEKLKEFGQDFAKVPVDRPVTDERSMYLLGAAPRWEDLFRGLDAKREITAEIESSISDSIKGDSIKIISILGSAGSGKSTILRRIGINLTQKGHTVYLTNSENIPSPQVIKATMEEYEEKVILLFDNSEIILGNLPHIISSLSKLENPPLIVIASRTNDFDRIIGRFTEPVEIQEFEVPNLSNSEIDEIIAILEKENLLGELKGLTQEQRKYAFTRKAKKQILIAMREATSGKGFDEIIGDEFEKLTPEETKVLYLCVALATDAGYRITEEEFVGCSEDGPSQALHLLKRNLRNIVIPLGPREDLLLLRHRLIAQHVVDFVAPTPLLREAYMRLMVVLALKSRTKNWRDRAVRLFQGLLDHKKIYKRFHQDIDEARSIYLKLAKYLSDDSHFWLQFGSLELEGAGGNLEFAENYIKQAESLNPEDDYIINTKGHLLLKKGLESLSLPEAIKLKDEGSKILIDQMEKSGMTDAYAIHIYCTQRYNWMRKWNSEDIEKVREELEHLREILVKASERHPKHKRINTIKEIVERAYLSLALKSNSRELNEQ